MSLRFFVKLALAVLLMLPFYLLPMHAPSFDVVAHYYLHMDVLEVARGCNNPLFVWELDRFLPCCAAGVLRNPGRTVWDFLHISFLLRVWLVGVGISLAFFMMHQMSCKRWLRRWCRAETDPDVLAVFRAEKELLGITRPVSLMRHRLLASPALVGCIHPVIMLPEDNFTPQELTFILRHELVHYKNKDIPFKLVLSLLRILLWFNPAIYAVTTQAHHDLELACDAQVLRDESKEARTLYAHLLLACAARKNPPVGTLARLAENAMEVKRRIVHICTPKTVRGWVLVGLVVLTSLVSAGVMGVNAARAGHVGFMELNACIFQRDKTRAAYFFCGNVDKVPVRGIIILYHVSYDRYELMWHENSRPLQSGNRYIFYIAIQSPLPFLYEYTYLIINHTEYMAVALHHNYIIAGVLTPEETIYSLQLFIQRAACDKIYPQGFFMNFSIINVKD